MKKTLLSFVLLFAATAMSAQTTIVKGDMNGDNDLTIADAVSVVDVILGKASKEEINVGGDPYAVDNTLVVGTWYAPDGTSFTLNADGTTGYPGATTYKFRPQLGTLLFFNASGKPVKKIVVDEVEKGRYLLTVNSATDDYTYYTSSASLVSGLTMSESTLTLNSGTTAQLSVTVTPSDALNASVAWTSSNESVATVDASGLVTAVAGGSCTITATATDGSGISTTCTVVVRTVHNPNDYVDLGLPSGTLWATCNVGADSPESYGDYFAWGETSPHSDNQYSWNSYKWCNGSYNTMTKYCTKSSYGCFIDYKTELDLEDDAAYMNWGSAWRMPSEAQYEELINSDYTTTTCTTQNGVYGLLITSKKEGYTDNSIFLPAAGSRDNSSLDGVGSYGLYWSRSLYEIGPCSAWYLNFNSSYVRTYDGNRYYGRSVRPVRVRVSE